MANRIQALLSIGDGQGRRGQPSKVSKVKVGTHLVTVVDRPSPKKGELIKESGRCAGDNLEEQADRGMIQVALFPGTEMCPD
ncbi:MAG: hypothetical protein DDG58_13035 [Ardenticatenia bacterium]|jgi:hypothetical protein|nr:MAG: hypothetical protein DDG58_13035 [Ardenticatenia bacterium]